MPCPRPSLAGRRRSSIGAGASASSRSARRRIRCLGGAAAPEPAVYQKRNAGPEQHDARRYDHGPEDSPEYDLHDKGGDEPGPGRSTPRRVPAYTASPNRRFLPCTLRRCGLPRRWRRPGAGVPRTARPRDRPGEAPPPITLTVPPSSTPERSCKRIPSATRTIPTTCAGQPQPLHRAQPLQRREQLMPIHRDTALTLSLTPYPPMWYISTFSWARRSSVIEERSSE